MVTTMLTIVLGIAMYKTSCKLSKDNRIVSAIVTLFAIYLMKPYIAARAQLVTFILLKNCWKQIRKGMDLFYC